MPDGDQRETAAKIDELVAALDRGQLGRDYVPGASAPWDEVRTRWARFRGYLDDVELAINGPFAPASLRVLRVAERLRDDDVYSLAFSLVHVAEAISTVPARRRRRTHK
jgi:hypothetical protein